MNNSPYLDLPRRSLAQVIADRALKEYSPLRAARDMTAQVSQPDKRRNLFLKVIAIIRRSP